mmetsp:Transcript_104545/g.164990  ORF Transcript_104545/g.164990 Transcript_104545/m.164990 type:complete len:874 (-) Transcript_104545:87-2708(-)
MCSAESARSLTDHVPVAVAPCQRKRVAEAHLQATSSSQSMTKLPQMEASELISQIPTPARNGFGEGRAAAPERAREVLSELAAAPAGGHIRVAVRVRPVPPGETSIIEVAGEGAIAIRKEAATGGNEFLSSQQGRTEERMFDRVFGPDAAQEEVYTCCCQPLVHSAVAEARSATVFVYGATGAGKTHTMFGERDEAQQGLICRAIRDVFHEVEEHAQESRSGKPLEVKVSFLDIYNESVRDLLQDGGGSCKVLEDERKGVVKVTNLREVVVRSPDEALKLLRSGMQARKVEATAANARSSRSHAVFSMTLEQVGVAPRGPGDPIFQRRGLEPRRLHARICLIDLAGSERATQTQNVGQALKDGAKINQSLLALANCIDALICKNAPLSVAGGRDSAQTPRKKPPYRDSKLTLLLKGSLTSDCLVSMIANVHPGRDHFEDSSNTLEYAKRASIVKAPIIVKRTRSSLPASLPASRRSPSPDSPRSSDSSTELIEEVSTPFPQLDFRASTISSVSSSTAIPPARRHRHRGTASNAPHQLTRTASAPVATTAGADTLTMGHLARRRRHHDGLEVELASSRQSPTEVAIPGSARSGIRPRAGTPEDRARATSSSKACSSSKEALPRQSDSSANCQAVETSQQDDRHASGRRHLTRCSESPIHTRTSSSFGTASPGGSSPVITEECPHPRSPLLDGPRSQSRRRNTSPLDLSTGGEGRLSTSTSTESLTSFAEDSSIKKEPMPSPLPVVTQAFLSTDSSSVANDHRTSPQTRARSSQKTRSQAGSTQQAENDAASRSSVDKEAVLLRLIDSLQAEKAALDGRLRAVLADHERVEADNARLRTANLEKDRQLALLLGRRTRESKGRRGCSSPNLRSATP